MAALDLFDLTGRIAVVTGGSRGIGFAIASAFAEAGATVVIANRKVEQGSAAAERIAAGGGKAIAIPVNVAEPASIEELIARTLRELGRVDILVNGAGRNLVKPALEQSAEDWDKVLNTNLRSVFLCSRCAAQAMKAQGGGKIISIASIAGRTAVPNMVGYCVSKAGVMQLSRALAVEWAPYKINVNAIAPAYVLTDFTRDWLADDTRRQEIEGRTPLGRVAEPQDVAGTALLLASKAGDYITGETIFVDGGWTAG